MGDGEMNHQGTRLTRGGAQYCRSVLVLACMLFVIAPLFVVPEGPARAQGVRSPMGHPEFGLARQVTPTPVMTPISAPAMPISTTAGPVSGSQQPRFTHITMEHGLSDRRVTSIIQDSAGFMWFGTTNGLNRYDGYNIVDFRNVTTDTNSLSGNYVTGLYEDRAGTLWIGTRSGLNAFDRRTEQFSRYAHDEANATSLGNNIVTSLYEDREGALWIGTLGGLYRLDRATGIFTRYSHDPDNLQSLSDFAVWDLHQDRAGTMWVGFDGGGLGRFDPSTGTFSYYRHDPADLRSLSDDRIDSILETSAGELWVGTLTGGVNVLDQARSAFDVYRHDEAMPASLANDSIPDIYEDRSGLIWVGTGGGGVDVYNPGQQAFKIYRKEPDSSASLASNIVSAAYEDGNGALWIGTRDSGLDRFDRQSGQIVHFPPDPSNPQALGFPFVSAIAEDPECRGGAEDEGRSCGLWVATNGGGLYRLDPSLGTFTGYRHDPDNPLSISNDTIVAMHFDRSSRLWIATRDGGLNRFECEGRGTTDDGAEDEGRRCGVSMLYRNDPSDPFSLSSDSVRAVLEDESGSIWVGTVGGGLNRLHPATGRFTRYRHDPEDLSSLGDDSVFALHIDREGVLWVGMFGGGLDRFNPADGTFTHYREAQGLASDQVMAIMEDNTGTPGAGNLWIVSGPGISRLGRDRRTMHTYDSADGLLTTEYTLGHYGARTGEMLVGSFDGLITFDPSRVRDDTYVPPVVLTNFLLANRPVAIGENSPLRQAIDLTERIELSYAERVIMFEFAGLSYRDPKNNRYRYKLEGFDPDWTEVDSTRRLVTYTNLSPGEYVFRVTASNADGVWNPAVRTITLVLIPPWWEMLWFRGLLVLLAAGIGLAFYRWRVSHLEKQRRRLEVRITEHTADLAQANSALEAQIAERKEAELALQYANTQMLQRVVELSVLNRITHTLTQWTDLNTVLEATGSMISELFNDAHIGIWVLDDSGMSLTNLIIVGDEQIASCMQEVSLASDPISYEVITHATTKVLSSSEAQAVIVQPPFLPVDCPAGNSLMLPLESRKAVIGLMSIRSTSPERAFTDVDVALAQTIGATLANVIENARLFAEAQAAAAEEERKRLARDLHDSVSQALFAANLTADVLPRLWELDPEQGYGALKDMQRFTHSALAEMRMLLLELRPKALIETPLHELLQTLQMATSAKSRAIIVMRLDQAPDLPPEAKIALYRVAQEALNNVLKHAGARHAYIILNVTPVVSDTQQQGSWHGTVTMQISDDGRGFDVTLPSQGRLGLETMRERAAGIGAVLEITSKPGVGTLVVMTWSGQVTPVEAAA